MTAATGELTETGSGTVAARGRGGAVLFNGGRVLVGEDDGVLGCRQIVVMVTQHRECI